MGGCIHAEVAGGGPFVGRYLLGKGRRYQICRVGTLSCVEVEGNGMGSDRAL